MYYVHRTLYSYDVLLQYKVALAATHADTCVAATSYKYDVATMYSYIVAASSTL